MQSAVIPDRSHAQRLTALQHANEIRARRSRLKKDMAAGRVNVADLLLGEIAPWLATMKVFDLLLAVPRVGRVRANAALKHCRVSPSRSLAGLTVRERAELLTELGLAGKGRP